MKKKIAIFGSTGSIGKTLINIVTSNKEKFDIVLLTANDNDKLLFKQAKKFNVKNLIFTSKHKFKYVKERGKKSNINVYNDFNNLSKIFKNKVDYIMSAITGIDGLEPTIKSIKFTKKIAIANKEAIICGGI